MISAPIGPLPFPWRRWLGAAACAALLSLAGGRGPAAAAALEPAPPAPAVAPPPPAAPPGAPPAATSPPAAPSPGAFIRAAGKLRLGDPVPRFEAVDIYGAEVNLDALLRAHKRPLLAFWSMYCKSCVEKFNAMVALQRKYASQGLVVISVNTDGEYRRGAQCVRDFVADYERRHTTQVNFPILYDERNWVAQAMNIEFLPLIVAVDSVGRVGGIYQSFGEGGDTEILAALEALVRQSLWLPPLRPRGGVAGEGSTALGASEASRGGLRVGDPIPRIACRELYGGEVDLDALLSRRTRLVLAFWSIYCEACVEKIKALLTVQERYAARGVKIVTVNTDGEYGQGPEAVRRFVADFEVARGVRLALPVLFDEQNRLPQALRIEFLPTIVSVGPDGRVLSIHQEFEQADEAGVVAGLDGMVRQMLERFAAEPVGAPATVGEP